MFLHLVKAFLAALRDGSVFQSHNFVRNFRAPGFLVLATLALIISASNAQAQEESVAREGEKSFKLYRWQEDYSYLANSERAGWEQFKYIPIPDAPGSWLSLGGEARYRLDAYSPYLFGIGPSGFSWASNQERILQHFDLHWMNKLRAFVQFDAALESGRPVQRAFDQSYPDLRNGFLDLILPARKGTLTVRGGRQELWLGASRWLAVRDPTNIRRSFDGVLTEYSDPAFTVRAFAARPVNIGPGWFDDTTFTAEYFRGGYAIVKNPFNLPATLDFYIYGRQQDRVTYARGSAREDRWTQGGRLTMQIFGFEAIAEIAHQSGTFGAATIDATGAFADVGRRLESLHLPGGAFTPKIGFRTHYASGDTNLKDTTLRNFVAAYPAAARVRALPPMRPTETSPRFFPSSDGGGDSSISPPPSQILPLFLGIEQKSNIELDA